MTWLNSEKKKKMAFIQNFIPKSKAQLIQVAMYMNKGDVQKAQEFVDFYASNLDLPDYEPVPPSFMDQIRGFFSWAKDNQQDILKGYQMIQSIIKNKGELIIPTDGEPLPDING